MPHTSRRKRTQPQQRDKRSKILLADGWTLVARSGAKARDEATDGPRPDGGTRAAGGEHSTVAASSPSSLVSAASIDSELTLADIERDYQSYMKRWKESHVREELVSVRNGIVGSYLGDCDGEIGIQQRVCKSVCVGLGSLCAEREDRARSFWQFVLWMDLCDAFDNFPFKRLTRFIQDPRFTALDKTFLSSLNITVLEHPAATTTVDHRTLLYTPFLPWTLILSDFLVRTPPPDFVITAGVEEIAGADVDLRLGEDAGKYSTEEKEKFRTTAERFLEGSRKMKVSKLEEFPSALMGLVCYWPNEITYEEARRLGNKGAGENDKHKEDEKEESTMRTLVEKMGDML